MITARDAEMTRMGSVGLGIRPFPLTTSLVALALASIALGPTSTALAQGPNDAQVATSQHVATAEPPALSPEAAPPQTPPPTARDIRKLLRRPPGSTSLGGTSSGQLLKPRSLPQEGAGYAIFPAMRDRETNFGTSELVALIKSASEVVQAQHPGTVIGVGNLGASDGGKIRWSVSHQSGRDADLGLLALDKRGRPTNLKRMVTFGRDLRGPGGLRFDTRRNLTLAIALIADPGSRVQYLFVAEWLKSAMIAEARRQQISAETITKLGQVLHQPSDSNPHANHYHVRLSCTVEDRLQGCLDRGPRRDWIDFGEATFHAHVDALIDGTRVESPRQRAQVITRLAALHAREALPRVVELLSDKSRTVRYAALGALRAFEDPKAEAGLLKALARTTDKRWAARLFKAILQLNHPDTQSAAYDLIGQPEVLLHPDAKPAVRDACLPVAIRILARWGRKEAVASLLPLLEHPGKDVRLATHDALTRITNQRVAGKRLRSSSRRRRARAVKAWHRFVHDNADDTWLQWMRQGFEARGFRFKRRMVSRSGVQTLIKAIGHKETYVSHNAVRVLSDITGHYVDPRWRNKRNNQRHWRHWWEHNGAGTKLRP